MMTDGLTRDEARSRCWLVDSKGLVQSARTDLTETKLPFAHDHEPLATLEEAVRVLKPTALIGTSTIPQSFTRAVIEQMARNTERPIIFPYSNPTSKSECTAEEAYTWTNGTAIFASGSPFPPVTLNNRTLTPGQGNNVYIFPAMGLAVFATDPKEIPDRAFSVAARTLAAMVTEEEFEKGLIYPPMANIRASSMHVAVAVATYFFDSGLARVERPANIDAYVRSLAWEPEY
jgi:malate dehydrogenase (oxaloacetate-decarboxylating)(NADP+)